MGSKARTAHDLVTPAVQGDIERIRTAAARVLSDREDPEAIHDFRVGLRRLRTVLRTSREIYGKKRVRELEAAFKRFGDATNALRDAEVLEETIEAARIDDGHAAAVNAWLAERRRRQEALRDDAVVVIQGDDLEEAFAALLDRIAKRPKKDMSMKRFAKTRLADVQAGVAELLPISRDDVAALHRLRIRFKRLRYTCEMLDRFVGAAKEGKGTKKRDAAFGKVAKQAKEMQKCLGLLHDADVAIETVAASDSLAADDRDAVTRGLLELRSKLVDESVDRLEALPPWVLGDED
jgi:CHAD domain-containing protein